MRADSSRTAAEDWRSPEPTQAARARFDAAYLDSVVRERVRRIGELHDRRTELAALESESVQRRAELERIDADERSSRAQLLKQEAARKTTLTRLAREIALGHPERRTLTLERFLELRGYP